MATRTLFTPSEVLRAKIKEFEGVRQRAYQDSKGVWTIGAGHTKGVRKGMWITLAQVDEYLTQDLATASNYVNRLNVCKTQGQFDALTDFAFNLGTKSLAHSTLLYKIKTGAPTAEIQRQFRRWVYSGKTKLAGLVKRRNWEAERWAQ